MCDHVFQHYLECDSHKQKMSCHGLLVTFNKLPIILLCIFLSFSPPLFLSHTHQNPYYFSIAMKKITTLSGLVKNTYLLAYCACSSEA